MAIILASASPRRRELLKFITEDFTVRVSDVQEITNPDLSPEETVKALAVLKGEAVAEDFPEDTVISADTIVVLDGKILGKPKNEEDAFSMLSSLSGRAHEVFTGVCIIQGGKKNVFAERTEVIFHSLSEEEIRAYIETGEPADKAGAYGIQGKGCTLVKSINGDYNNVVGLPVSRLNRILKESSLI